MAKALVAAGANVNAKCIVGGGWQGLIEAEWEGGVLEIIKDVHRTVTDNKMAYIYI